MSSVCLIRPPAVESFRFATGSITAPLGLAYITAAIEAAGHAVHVVDAVGEGPRVRTHFYKGYLVGLRLEDIVQRIPSDAEVVGITVIFTHEWPAIVRLVDLIKAARPDVTVILGGEHITSMPEFCLTTAKADYLVLGEGEETVVELLDALAASGDLRGVPGLAFHDGDAVAVNPRRSRRTEIDDIPAPAWDRFDLAAYHKNRFVGGMYSEHLTVPVLATRGCPYQCTYCSAPNMWLPRWIPRDPKLVADEIEHYVTHYGARNFPFQDLTAILQKKWIVTFCNELIDRQLDITWQLPTGTRCEPLDAEVADLLRRTGMTNMPFAPESGSETTRRLIKKKMKTDILFRSIEDSLGSGLNVSIFLVIGFPHDKAEHLAENLPFLERLVDSGVKDVSVGFYMALPGTEIFNSLYDSGRIKLDRSYFRHILDSLSLVPSQSYCDDLSRLDLFKWKLRMYLHFYRTKGVHADKGGLFASIRRAVSGVFSSGGHDSKLQTAVRHGLQSGFETVASRFGPRWLPRDEEVAMFSDWDNIFRRIRTQRLAAGAARPTPEDTADLHKKNVISILAQEHGGNRFVADAAE